MLLFIKAKNILRYLSQNIDHTETTNFAMAQFSGGRSTGTVTDGMFPVPGAMIRVFDKSHKPLVTAVTDSAGRYELKVSKSDGPYYIVPYKAGFTYFGWDYTFDPNQFNVIDMMLMIGDYRVAGRVIGSDGKGIGGIWMEAQRKVQNGLTSAAITDSDGFYELYTFQGDFEFPVPTDNTVPNLSSHGYLIPETPLYTGQNAVYISTTDVQVPDIYPVPSSGSIVGRVADQADVGIPGVLVKAIRTDNDASKPVSYGVTDSYGQFKIGIFSYGNWSLTPNGLIARPSYIGTVIPDLTANGGPVALTGYPVTARVKGTVKNSSNVPIPGVIVKLRNQASTVVTTTKTATDGSYTIEGFVGDWFIDALTEDLGYADNVERVISAGPGDSTVDFVANPLP